jgi:hypothetical protein
MSHIIDEAVKDFANAIGLRNYDWGRACPCFLAFREIIRPGSYKGCPNAIGWGDNGATTRLPHMHQRKRPAKTRTTYLSEYLPVLPGFPILPAAGVGAKHPEIICVIQKQGIFRVLRPYGRQYLIPLTSLTSPN